MKRSVVYAAALALALLVVMVSASSRLSLPPFYQEAYSVTGPEGMEVAFVAVEYYNQFSTYSNNYLIDYNDMWERARLVTIAGETELDERYRCLLCIHPTIKSAVYCPGLEVDIVTGFYTRHDENPRFYVELSHPVAMISNSSRVDVPDAFGFMRTLVPWEEEDEDYRLLNPDYLTTAVDIEYRAYNPSTQKWEYVQAKMKQKA